MSRGAWVGIIIVAIIVVVVVVVALVPSPLSNYTKSTARDALRKLDAAEAKLGAHEKRIGALTRKYPAYLKRRVELVRARADLKRRKEALKRADDAAKQLMTLLERDRSEDRMKVFRSTSRVKSRSRRAVDSLSRSLEPLESVVAYRRDAAKIAAGAARDKKLAAEMPTASLRTAVRAASKQHPKAAAALRERMKKFAPLERRADALVAAFESARSSKPVAYVKAGRAAEALAKTVGSMTALTARTEQSIADLDHDIDKILADMRSRGTIYEHRYRIVTDGKAKLSKWVTVRHTYYLAHMEHLGMGLFSKPRGLLDEQANTVAHPPGYNYVGRPSYGHWVPAAAARAGDKTPAGARRAEAGERAPASKGKPGMRWEFDGDHAGYAKALCATGALPAITFAGYTAYRSAHDAGRAYFGSSKRFGTKGSHSKRDYHKSLFLTRRRHVGSTRAGYRSGGYRSGYHRTGSYGGYGK